MQSSVAYNDGYLYIIWKFQKKYTDLLILFWILWIQGKKLAKSSSMFLHVPSTKLKGMEDFVEESEYYESYEKVAGIPIEIKKHPFIEWPEHLDAFTFPTGSPEHFEQPRR